MENATCGKRNFNDVTSLLHGRLPEYPIAQRFLEIGFEISACANSVYQAFLLSLLKRLGSRLPVPCAMLRVAVTMIPAKFIAPIHGLWSIPATSCQKCTVPLPSVLRRTKVPYQGVLLMLTVPCSTTLKQNAEECLVHLTMSKSAM